MSDEPETPEEPKGKAPVRKLYRSRDDRLIGGVAGGLGEYFGIDPLLVRIGMLLLLITVVGFPPMLIAYMVLWAAIPLQGATPEKPADTVRENMNEMAEIARSVARAAGEVIQGRHKPPAGQQ